MNERFRATFQALREKAEQLLSDRETHERGGRTRDLHRRDLLHLAHELEVNQIELEVQNEELRRVQKDLEEAREEFFDLYDSAPVAYVTLDEKGFIEKANQAAYRMLEESPLGKPFLLWVHSEDLTVYRSLQLELESRREAGPFELRLRGRGGVVHLQVEAALNADGGVKQRRLALVDISERKRMEEELRRSHDELEQRVKERTAEIQEQAELIDLARDAIILEETDGTIRLWSRGAVEMYGWSKEEAHGRIMRELLQTEYPVPRGEILARFLKGGYWEGELIHTRKGGTRLKVLSRWTLKKAEGETDKIMIINHDITDRLRLEEQLRQAQKMEALGVLAGGIAHDFNNLLMPVLLNTEMALMDVRAGVLPPAELMETAIAGANRGKELVKQIITFSRHKGEPLRPLNIAPITKETVKFLRSVTPATVQFKTRIEDPSPPVMANPTQIHQVLMNLVNNAADSMQERGGILEIGLETVDKESGDGVKPGPYILLKVKDTGSGMSPEVKEKAFDPFFTTKGPGKGTGMGLAVVHGIVRKHGGEIRLESEAGKGTTVSVFLPVFQGEEKEELPPPALDIKTGNERILFVDDEEVQTLSMGTMLQRLGYRVVVETDPRKALEMFRV
ncbi:MAG TPA: ATP-binding protein, partial [Thermodesulfobacteriota bacterium]|nr:ATP-binding protein [Thermodesulfobacteriota bacterium]